MTNHNLLPTKLMQYQEKIMRISKMITLKRNALILYQILSTNSWTKCMEISLENLCSKIILSFKGPKFQNSIKIGTKGVYRRGCNFTWFTMFSVPWKFPLSPFQSSKTKSELDSRGPWSDTFFFKCSSIIMMVHHHISWAYGEKMKRYEIIDFEKGEFWHHITPKEFRAPGENRTHDPLSSSLDALTSELLEALW